MRVVIIGAKGLLGKYLIRDWAGDAVQGLGSHQVDVRDADSVLRILGAPLADVIVLAAAYTDVDGCELNPDLAYAVNRDGALNVARAARKYGSKLIFLSTDYVFDGAKSVPYESDDMRNPRSVYGKSKALAEAGILEISGDACIVRTSWLYGVGGKCFPDTILKLAASREQLQVVDDQRGCPTYAHDLSRAIITLSRAQAKGIVHVTNSGDCTWFEFAKEILRQSGSATKIIPVTTDQFPRPAPRPKYSVLSSASLHSYGITMRCWRRALSDYFEERQSCC